MLAVEPARKGWLRTAALHYNVPLTPLGRSGGGRLIMRSGSGALIDADVTTLWDTYDNALGRLLATA